MLLGKLADLPNAVSSILPERPCSAPSRGQSRIIFGMPRLWWSRT